MTEKNEVIKINDCEVVDTGSNDILIPTMELAAQVVAVIPNAIAAPFQRYHEVEVKKELKIKEFEYKEKALEIRTMDRDKICDTIVELAKIGNLDNEKFQMLMVAYANMGI